MLNIILPNKLRMVKKLFATRGSRNSKTRAREGGASVFTFFSFLFFVSAPPPSEKIAGGFQRAGVKKLKENCFALLAEVRRAETRSGAIRAFFAQNRFELRSVIAKERALASN